jgi:class 3 adenylate cyclase/tetratricopeptide (TPR) repeat protein
VHCSRCGAEAAADALFCGRCGAALDARCPACDAPAAPGLAFCTACGTRLAAADESAADERKLVTIFFVDMVGFTGRAERLDPEEVRAVLRPYHRRLRQELERFGGTVEKFIGDAVMAVFGAPVAHEDDAERAVRAGFAVRDAVVELNERDPALDLHVRIGVNTGEAVVTPAARAGAGESVVSGDVVNTGARLQAAAPVDGILVGAATERATRRRIRYRAVAPVQAKGKADPVPAWEALAPRARYGMEVAQPGEAPLVGRAAELAALQDALERVRRRRSPELMTLVGAPGIGKSRLVFELFRAADAAPELAHWRQGRCLPYGGGPLGGLAEIVRAHAGILATDDHGARRRALRVAVADALGDAPDAPWVEAHLRPLAGVDGELRLLGDHRAEAFAAWRRFLEALAAQRPVVLVFEDIHWADEPLLDFLVSLLEWATESPFLVVATARPEFADAYPGWPAAPVRSATLGLAPLSEVETARLVSALLHGALVPAEMQAALLGGAGGNPLYAEEYVRMLRDQGVLRRAGDGWRLARHDDLPTPESVQSIIAARLDALPGDEKSLVQDASVVGKVFWLGALERISGRSRWAVAETLNRLAQKELVRREPQSSVVDEPAYAFRHALVPTVAYGQIPHARRCRVHRRAVEWIESIAGEHVAQFADALAHHYRSALRYAAAGREPTGTLTSRARDALRDAGDRAATLNAFDAASRLYASALELPPGGDRAGLLLRHARARFRAGGAGVEELESARDALVTAGDRESAAEAEIMLGELLWSLGRGDDAAQRFTAAQGLVEGRPPTRATVYALANISRFLAITDAYEPAIELGRAALAQAGELELPDLCAHALVTIGVSRVATGDTDGVADLERAVALARQAGSAEGVRACLNLASTLANLGDLRRAFAIYAEGRDEAVRFGDTAWLRRFESERLFEWYWTGRWDDALAATAEVINAAEGAAPTYADFDARLVRAWIALMRGDVAAALAETAFLVEFADGAGAGQFQSPALAARARAVAAAARPAETVAAATQLLAGWRRDREPLVGFWASDLGIAVERAGRADLLPEPGGEWLAAAAAFARRDFARAAERYAAIGARPEEALALVRAVAAGQNVSSDAVRDARAFLAGVGVDPARLTPAPAHAASG